MLNIRIPLLFAVSGCVISSAATYVIAKNNIEKKLNVTNNASGLETSYICKPRAIRLNGLEYIKPLLFVDEECESQRLLPVKQELEKVIDKFKTLGVLNSASIYLRHYNSGEWITINPNERYNPGSLMKVPELITFMKMNEKTPGLLDKKIIYDKPMPTLKNVVFTSKSIELGKTYSVRELLYYMIAYSDNKATMILNAMMDSKIFKKVFEDLGNPSPDLTKKDIPMTATEYSRFMRAIYNASYLSIEDSEFCAELLSKSDFVGGLISGLPKNTKSVHKFGEAGDEMNNAHFSEAGIIYTPKSIYLITVMTKGKNIKDLPGVVSEISSQAYATVNSEL